MPGWLPSVLIATRIVASSAVGLKLAGALPDRVQAVGAFIVFVVSTTLLSMQVARSANRKRRDRHILMVVEVLVAVLATVTVSLPILSQRLADCEVWDMLSRELQSAATEADLLRHHSVDAMAREHCDEHSGSRCALLLDARHIALSGQAPVAASGSSYAALLLATRAFRVQLRQRVEQLDLDVALTTLQPTIPSPHFRYGHFVSCLVGAPYLLARILGSLFALLAPALLLERLHCVPEAVAPGNS